MLDGTKQTVVIAGGGLAGMLLYVALRARGTSAELHERGPDLGGEHTWSFHDTDVPAGAREWLEPLISRSWPEYEVRFPSFTRRLGSPYHAIRSVDLARYVRERFGDGVRLNSPRGDADFLATGWPAAGPGGYQKFIGLDISTPEPHGVTRPLLMDARVAQHDGYRFVYLLPWSRHDLLVEDTYYSDTASLDGVRPRLDAYVRGLGFGRWKILREERGALPLAFHADRTPFDGKRIGAAAGLAHPVTGYTLPLTLRQVQAALEGRLVDEQTRIRGELRFFHLLNRMLFRAAEPKRRRAVLERFYALDESLIQSFYRGRLSAFEKTRVLCGRPPVPVWKAVRELVR